MYCNELYLYRLYMLGVSMFLVLTYPFSFSVKLSSESDLACPPS